MSIQTTIQTLPATVANKALVLTSLADLKAMNIRTGGKFSSVEYTKPIHGKKRGDGANGGALIGYVTSNYNSVQINVEYGNRAAIKKAVANGERVAPELKKNETKFMIDGLKVKHNSNTGNVLVPINYASHGAVQYFLLDVHGDKFEVSKEQFAAHPALLAGDNPLNPSKANKPTRDDLQALGQELYRDLMIHRITAIR